MWRWAECELSLCLLPRIKYLLAVLARFCIHTHTQSVQWGFINPARTTARWHRPASVHPEPRPSVGAKGSAGGPGSYIGYSSDFDKKCLICLQVTLLFFSWLLVLFPVFLPWCLKLRPNVRYLAALADSADAQRGSQREKLTFNPVHRDSQADKSLLLCFTYPQFIAIRTRCHIMIEKHVEVKVIKLILWL